MKQTVKKEIVPVAVAVVMGLLGIVGINRYVKARTAPVIEETVFLVVAAQAIEPGQEIFRDMLETREVPLRHTNRVQVSVAAGDSPASRNEAEEVFLSVVGRQVNRPLEAGDPLLWVDLEKDAIETLSRTITAERRAITIPVDGVTGLSSNIVAGDRIDVIATVDPSNLVLPTIVARDLRSYLDIDDPKPSKKTSEETPTPVTVLLMQDIVVLAAGAEFRPPTFQQAHQQRGGYASVTLEVTPEEAVLLTHARQFGSLSFTLRNPDAGHRIDDPVNTEVTHKTFTSMISSLDHAKKAGFTVYDGNKVRHEWVVNPDN